MPTPADKHFDAAESAHFLQVAQAASKAISELHASLWLRDDALRPLSSAVIAQKAQCLQSLAAVKDACNKLRIKLGRLVHTWAHTHDVAALQALAHTPDQAGQIRQRMAQADQSLKALYPQLLALCQQAAKPLQQEWQSPRPTQPLHDARAHVELCYSLAESDPQFDPDQDNILATQDVLSWATGPDADAHFSLEEQAMRIHDNWLDYKHPFMSHQCWLTHDLLEHDYGQNPRMTVSALLRTEQVHVDVHTTRSYVYDMRTGEFLQP